jgi:membrane protease YdiL (CAAX protease family)
MLLKSLLTNKYVFLVLFSLLPVIDQITTQLFGYYVGFVMRIIIHIGIPLLFARSILKKLYFSFSKKAAIVSGIFFVGTVALLFGLFFLLRDTFDAELLRSQLALIYDVTPASYLVVATLISFVNPFLEETYWRAFLYGKTRILWGGILATRNYDRGIMCCRYIL